MRKGDKSSGKNNYISPWQFRYKYLQICCFKPILLLEELGDKTLKFDFFNRWIFFIDRTKEL